MKPLIFGAVVAVCLGSNSAQELAGAAQKNVEARDEHGHLEFDAVSIKVHGGSDTRSRFAVLYTGYQGTNITLSDLLVNAFTVRKDQIRGLPKWDAVTRFDIEAKMAGDNQAAYKELGGDGRRILLQEVLRQRFRLESHFEPKEQAVYLLEVEKGGSKLRQSPVCSKPVDECPKGRFSATGGSFSGRIVSMQNLISQITEAVHRDIVDKTGLSGQFDVDLKWASEDQLTSGDAESASILTALKEQLGLKLVPAKGMVNILSVDRVELPSQN